MMSETNTRSKTLHGPQQVCHGNEGAEKDKAKKSVSAVAEGDTSSVISAGPSASQVGGNSSIITLPSSTQYKQQKCVGKIEEHRLLMVKAGQELQSSIQIAESTLAEQREVSQLEATKPIPKDRLLKQVMPFWH